MATAVVLVAVAGVIASQVPSGKTSMAPGSSAHTVNSFVTRSGSELELNGQPWRFTGANMYWLGLDENVRDSAGATYPTEAAIDNGFKAAVSLGARMVRSTTLGVSVGSSRSLEPSLNEFNDAAFASIDYSLYDARRHGLRLTIPLIDQWHYYEGGKHTFTAWRGHADLPGQTATTSGTQRDIESAFYSDPVVVQDFQDYVAHILNHVNPLTKLRLGSDPTVAIWETGNEIWDAPTKWTEETAKFIKSLAPHALVADGSVPSGSRITQAAATEPDVDVVDGHFYPVNPTQAPQDAQAAESIGKVFVVGEYPLNGPETSSWLTKTGSDDAISGDLAWSLLPRNSAGVPEQHDDGYTFHYPGATASERSQVAELKTHAANVNR